MFTLEALFFVIVAALFGFIVAMYVLEHEVKYTRSTLAKSTVIIWTSVFVLMHINTALVFILMFYKA